MSLINEGTSGATSLSGRPLPGTNRYRRSTAYLNQPKGWNNDPTQYASWLKYNQDMNAWRNQPNWQKSFEQSFSVRKPLTAERKSEIDERNKLYQEIAINIALELAGTQGTYGRLAKAVGKGIYQPYKRYQYSRNYRSKPAYNRLDGNRYSTANRNRGSSRPNNQSAWTNNSNRYNRKK